jgi:hypothetical protein
MRSPPFMLTIENICHLKCITGERLRTAEQKSAIVCADRYIRPDY